MPLWVDKLKVNLGLAEEEVQEQTLLQQLDAATTLDRTQRAIGFATCVGIGLLLTFMAPLFLLRPVKFALVYSLGNILSLCSTMFLMGPAKQVARMFDAGRWISTVVYLSALVLTIVSALVFHSIILSIICIFVQFVALMWYAISYIPYGQAYARRLLGLHVADSAAGG
ncbi:hypothetical protein D9Q98_007041 [Chlorella vulgaris]|uniref:Vesicle transport protein n=1 Tax=Chlorella vulgaris TaxID=3077 RepID=A0A9D4TJD7_CHLVU|nr:hypothetical protein D9Q98_007041 [Chlorella vulgaris]